MFKNLLAGFRWQVPALALLIMLTVTGADRRAAFNDSWRFSKGEASGAAQPSFDDTGWRKVTLPHDWAIEGPFDIKNNANTGGLPISGVAWYRKHFQMPADGKDRFY